MYPHRIRLHGPWDYEPVARTVVRADGLTEQRPGTVPPAGRVKIPATWMGTPLEGFRGRVRWRRPFHAPRSLEPHEQVWLILDGVDYFAEVSLNDTLLGCHEGYFEPFAFEITSLVRPRNELVVDVNCPTEFYPSCPWMLRAGLESLAPEFVGGMWRDVALEIRSFAFLRDVIVRATLNGSSGLISVAGSVVGTGDLPVELDLRVSGVSVSRQRLQGLPDEVPFAMSATVDRVDPWWPSTLGGPNLYRVCLELHGAAQTLDFAERFVGFRDLTVDPSASLATINGREMPIQLVEIDSRADPLLIDKQQLGQYLPGPRGQSGSPGLLPVYRFAGRIVAPQVYEWMDRNGLLLMQDFPAQAGLWSPSGHDQARSKRDVEVVRQAEAMVRLLGHHASIACWHFSGSTVAGDRRPIDIARSVIKRVDPVRCKPN